nr:hypothetical protein [Gordonia sp. NB41Y]
MPPARNGPGRERRGRGAGRLRGGDHHAEAAASRNPTWWNEVRTHSDDACPGEYCSSMLLGTLLQSAAHRLGVPAADVWAHIRRTGELPL